MLPLPAPYSAWDPLIQAPRKLRVAPAPVVATGAAIARQEQVASVRPPAKIATPFTATPFAAQTARPAPDPSTPAAAVRQQAPTKAEPASPPPNAREALEAQSLALAWQLQQEEQQAFLGAISASTPSPPRSARGAADAPASVPPGEAPTPDSDDASLQLALRLQREVCPWSDLPRAPPRTHSSALPQELRWHELQSHSTVAASGTPVRPVPPAALVLPPSEDVASQVHPPANGLQGAEDEDDEMQIAMQMQ